MAWEPANAQRFFDDLLSEIPEFSDSFNDHIADNEELLPYVLMDNFSRFVIEMYVQSVDSGSADCMDIFERSISFLNKKFSSSDDDIQVMINTTFCETIEALGSEGDTLKNICERLSPELQACINIIE